MDRARSLYTAYILAALLKGATRKDVEMAYGSFGVSEAIKGIRDLCEKHELPLPAEMRGLLGLEPDPDETTYTNNEETRKTLGWGDFPEHCQGDRESRFVTHNHRKGIFVFHNEERAS